MASTAKAGVSWLVPTNTAPRLAPSRRGEQSRIWYHLNRPGLSGARQEALARVRRDWNVLVGIFSSQDTVKVNSLEEIKSGLREYRRHRSGSSTGLPSSIYNPLHATMAFDYKVTSKSTIAPAAKT